MNSSPIRPPVPGLHNGPDRATYQGEEPISTVQIGIDLAKAGFEVAVSALPGQVLERRRLSRAGFGRYVEAHPPAENLPDA